MVTDEHLADALAPGIVAVGDIAARWSRRYTTRMRVEHWDDASTGRSLPSPPCSPRPGDIEPHDPVPYFWSDQLGHTLQYVGRHTETDRLVWRERENGSWTALWLAPDNKLSAALVADLPRENAQAQMAIMRDLVLDPALLTDPAVPLTKAVAG